MKAPILLLSVVSAMLTAPAFGAPAECSKPEKPVSDLSESAYDSLQTAMELMSKSKHDEAIQKLTKAAGSGSDYEKAMLNYNLAVAYNGKNDQAGSAKAFAKALSYNALPRAQTEQTQANLGQLYIVTGQFDEGIKVLQDYIATACSAVPVEVHNLLASALIEKKRFQEALPQVEQAIAKSKTPKENLIAMKLAISYELKEYPVCAQALVQLIGLVPAKPEYWRQLSSIFYEMKRDAESVAVLALSERQGFVEKPNEIKNLYSVYMEMELPLKAGNLIQNSIDKKKLPADESNLESLANAWINARESAKAEATLKKLASMSEKGEYYYKLGGMYGDREEWKESKEMLQKALEKGGLKRPGDVWFRLAVAHYSLKDTQAAVASLQKAVTFDETRKQAGDWLRHLSSQFAAEQQGAGKSSG